MRPHIINDKKNFISGWYIDENLCDSIVEACSGRNRLKFNGRLKSSFNGYLFSQIKTLSEQLHVQYISELTKVVDLYKKEYPFLNNEMENFEIEKFEQTEFVLGGEGAQLAQRLVANAALGRGDGANERRVIVVVG